MIVKIYKICRFKVKVGTNREDDNRRLAMVRDVVGPDSVIVRIILKFI